MTSHHLSTATGLTALALLSGCGGGGGVKASGSSLITSAADFSIPLAGNAIHPDIERKKPDILDPITGKLVGAFFGPKAAEAGAFVTLDSAGDSVWSSVPFLLEKR